MPATSNGRGKQRGKIPITAGSSAPRRHRDADEELDELRHGAELRRDRMAEPNAATTAKASAASAASSARDAVLDLKSRIGKSVLGQERMVESMLIALLANGNLLIESLPGLAKTRAIKTLAKHLAADLSRVQFTPDLLPSDVTGAEIYLQTDKGGQFQFQKGPIFANLVLADEINRAPAKVQSALLEAMEERQVTVAGKTYKMPDLFMVLATENPIEQEGTYPLPEAQLDRFLMHVVITYPDEAVEGEIIKLNRAENAQKPKVRAADPAPVPQQAIFDARAEIDGVFVSDLAQN